MNVVKVEKRDTHIVLDFSLQEIYYLKRVLDNSEIEYNSEEDPLMGEVIRWFDEDFYPLLKELNERIQE